MRRTSLALSFLLVTTALARAESEAEKAFKAAMDDINKSGLLTMQVGSTHYDSNSDTLTAQNVRFDLDWTLPIGNKADSTEADGKAGEKAEKKDISIKASFSAPAMVAKGLHLEEDGVGYASMTYERMSFDAKLDSPGTEDDMFVAGKAVGNANVTNGFAPFLGEFKIAPSRPIGSVMDYLRPLIFKVRYESYSDEGATLTQRLTQEGPVTQQDQFGPLVIKDIANGRIGSMEMAYRKGVVSPQMSPPAKKTPKAMGEMLPFDEITYEMGKTSYVGYDFGALWAAFDPKAPAFEGSKNIIESADIQDIKAEAPGLFSFTVGPSVQKGIKVTQPETFIIPMLDKMLSEDKTPDDLPPEQQKAMIKAGFDLIRGFAMDLNEMSDMKLSFAIPEGKHAGQTIKASLDAMRQSNFDRSGIEEISISGVSFDGPPAVKFTLKRAAVENLEFPNYEQIEKVLITSMSGKEPAASDLAKLSPPSVDIVVSGLDYKDQQANNLSAKELRSELRTRGLAIPTDLSVKVDDLVISKSMIKHPIATALMTQLGMEELTVNKEVTLSWDEVNETIKLDPFSVELANIVSLNGSIGFGGIKRAYMESPENAQAAMATATVLPSTLRLTNLGGMDKLINFLGGMAGMGPDQVRSFAEGQVQVVLSSVTKPDFARMVAGHIKTFLNNPETLEIALKPKAPVPVMQVLGSVGVAPDTVPDMLQIGVSANGL